jgi:tetratricopeptide (TPR) repeat protein
MKKTHLLICFTILANLCGLVITAQTAPFQYKAKLPEGINTINDAQQDVIKILGKTQTVFLVESSDYSKVRLMSQKTFINKAVIENHWIVITTRLITYKLNVVISINRDFIVYEFPYQKESGKTGEYYRTTIDFADGTGVHLGSLDKELMCRLADDFYFVKKQTFAELNNKELTRFNSVIAKYKELAIKPQPTEEQRKLIVQANAAAQTKDYNQAIAYYQQLLQVSETSYPEAYFNLALLYGQEILFDNAILNMKKYLLLKPDATDARAAQDKIYEWEAGINK